MRTSKYPITGVEVRIFESGRSHDPRPLTIWFLASCPEQRGVESGSQFGAGKDSFFGPALENLNSDYSMGVAHWCGIAVAAPMGDPHAVVAIQVFQLRSKRHGRTASCDRR